MMNLANILTIDSMLQITANITLLYGLYAMGNHKLRGPILAGISEILWIVIGITHNIPGLCILSIILAIMQIRNSIKWYKEKVSW